MAPAKQRSYPRVANIKDQDTKETIRLLWDAVHNQTDTAATSTASLTAANSTIGALQSTISKMQKQLTQVSAGSGVSAPAAVGGGGSGGTSGGSGSPPVVPNDHPDQTAVVTQAKADLVAALIDLSGCCGSFQIVKLTAWRLKDIPGQESISLVRKGGTTNCDPSLGAINCDGYSPDAIMYDDGTVWDLLINSDNGTDATPNWGYAGTRPLSDARPPIAPAI
tara:strand:+ start:382 stop:1047 length:666 start_codon:yes stop_codon:yes gene_type:complete